MSHHGISNNSEPSLIQGCSLVWFIESGGVNRLFQESANPTVYTKLSCHLPWIAEQYDMDFDAGDTEPECEQGIGGGNTERETRECRSVPGSVSNIFDQFAQSNLLFQIAAATESEAECIFPFYWEGQLYEECTMLEHDRFLYRTFYCPVLNTTNKINGINSFTFDDFIKQVTQKPILVFAA